MDHPASPRILISRQSAIGDCIHTMPLACALRERYPKAYIVWVVGAGAAPLLANHEALDKVITVERRWFRSPSTVLKLRRQLKALRLDVSIDTQSLTKSALVAWLSGARQRIAFGGKQCRELSRWLNNQCIPPTSRHVVDRCLELARPLGVESPMVRFGIAEDEAANDTIDTFLRNTHLGCPFAVVNPGAGWSSRVWPANRYAKVAKYLGQRYELPSVVIWAGDRERDWARQIVSGSGGHAIIAPATTLVQLAALLRTARMFIGSDTGPLHLAAAVGTPCLGLYGATHHEVSGPYGPGHIAIQKSFQPGRRGPGEAMRAIEIDSVCRACDEMAARQFLDRVA